MTKPAGTHSGASVTTERPAPASSDNCSRSPAPGCSDPVGTVHARALRADERAFQMQAENAVAAGRRARRRNGAAHLLARVGDPRSAGMRWCRSGGAPGQSRACRRASG